MHAGILARAAQAIAALAAVAIAAFAPPLADHQLRQNKPVAVDPKATYSGTEASWDQFRPAADEVARIRTRHPDDFAFSTFSESTVVIAFRGRMPAGATNALRLTGTAVSVVEHVGYTETSLRNEASTIAQTVLEVVPNGTSVAVTPIPSSGIFEVALASENPSTLATAARDVSGLTDKWIP